MNIVQAIADPNLFGAHFRGDTWYAWRTVLRAIFALPMVDQDRALYHACTGRQEPPEAPSDEVWLVCGRRSGKSFILALIAVYLACFRDWTPHLGPGERATVMILACDRRQARVIMRYVNGLLSSTKLLEGMVQTRAVEKVDLTNRTTIEIHTASFRTVRGYSIVAALCDELAFWRSDEGANPDTEVLDAIRPAMATVPGSMLLCASSPYSRRGALWDAYRRHYGKANGPLVWKAATRTMNPKVSQKVIDNAMERDPDHAKAEYMAEFRSDLEAFLRREVVERLIEPGIFERPKISGIRYRAFVDPSGGSSDSFTMAVAHREGEIATLDCVREVRPPFSPEGVAAEFATLLKAYNCTTVVGDRYSGEWVREAFRKNGIRYQVADKTKSQLYAESLALFNSARVELLDSPRLVSQLCSLERRTNRSGRDSIDHAVGSHDDVANAVAGVLTETVRAARATGGAVALTGV